MKPLARLRIALEDFGRAASRILPRTRTPKDVGDRLGLLQAGLNRLDEQQSAPDRSSGQCARRLITELEHIRSQLDCDSAGMQEIREAQTALSTQVSEVTASTIRAGVLDRKLRAELELLVAFLSQKERCDFLDTERIEDFFAIAKRYRDRFGQIPNVANPRTFNEKLQAAKLRNRSPLLRICSDKIAVRDYVARTVGDRYLIPLIATYERPEAIDFGQLPDRYVLKTNHASAQVILVDGERMRLPAERRPFDGDFIVETLRRWMAVDYYRLGREWGYKGIVPKIMAEELLAHEIQDYKFHCFDGKAASVQVILDRSSRPLSNFYDLHWRFQDFSLAFPRDPTRASEPPSEFDEMKEFAERLAAPFDYVRVDLYAVSGSVFFGELTFYPNAGFGLFEPAEMDAEFGASWNPLHT